MTSLVDDFSATEFNDFPDKAVAVTDLRIGHLDQSRLHTLKKDLYYLVEGANQLGISIEVVNMEQFRISKQNCNHHMQSCGRQEDLVLELCQVLMAITSSTHGRRTHQLRILD